mgnify:CR=1 FL=1|tara:strand:+ start:19825 stop:21036 length:1212 start_codon:yes stop_codon:yes gene_type:complete
MRNKIHIVGGGTINPIAGHLSLCSYAQGGTARRIERIYKESHPQMETVLHLSKMAGGSSFHTTDELRELVEKIKADPETRIIVMNAAVCDFEADGGDDTKPRPGKHLSAIEVNPTPSIIKGIRDSNHKQIFLVGFKNTVNKGPGEMFLDGLTLCKSSSCNLVFVNDSINKRNMIITPEEATYADGWERDLALKEMCDISILRSHLTFTQSTVIAGEPIAWESEEVPGSLREIVNYCIKGKAYKPFKGATVGHFAHKTNDQTFLTSIRRSNFNDLEKVGLVKVMTDSPDSVIAYGAKPSVGGQSQRIIFNDHKGMDCVVHFHCPMLDSPRDEIPIKSQREVECGSHQCGKQTSDGLKRFGNLKAVMLENHGPNIVFSKNIDPKEVIDFIKSNFSLEDKTGGYNI